MLPKHARNELNAVLGKIPQMGVQAVLERKGKVQVTFSGLVHANNFVHEINKSPRLPIDLGHQTSTVVFHASPGAGFVHGWIVKRNLANALKARIGK